MHSSVASPKHESTDNGLYAPGVDHYTSPHRRDPVKKLWEEPVTFAILQAALAEVPQRQDLSVMDIGCGAGEGLHLLRALSATRNLSGLPRLTYRGLDLDEGLLSLAARTHHEEDDAEFWHGDVRTDLPETPFDLYLSCGVPYSHLTEDELRATLTRLFDIVRRHRTRSVAVIDVLGRHSLEWLPQWGRTRWPYRMSFFQSDQQTQDVPMTFWDAHHLNACISAAAADAGCRVQRRQLFDRSIMVGRHTATGHFNPELPPYRSLINRLESGSMVPLEQLRAPRVPDDSPEAVRAFFGRFRSQWNAVLDAAASQDPTRHLPPDVAGPMLARGLRAVEHRLACGLGVGHSLTAVITVSERT
ncbi:class I SAM-dependent methyltransferase [Streptomyces monomycini]|uniref:class I SAM-dependent methyltransferase n=1 Tax=Streptomyces monomycini TaxID=371720 RepID=UPI0004AB7F64|nr:class I SAM-dependent methyltransferase [Streptomyces monomycini]